MVSVPLVARGRQRERGSGHPIMSVISVDISRMGRGVRSGHVTTGFASRLSITSG